jgi:hypothetical protein
VLASTPIYSRPVSSDPFRFGLDNYLSKNGVYTPKIYLNPRMQSLVLSVKASLRDQRTSNRVRLENKMAQRNRGEVAQCKGSEFWRPLASGHPRLYDHANLPGSLRIEEMERKKREAGSRTLPSFVCSFSSSRTEHPISFLFSLTALSSSYPGVSSTGATGTSLPLPKSIGSAQCSLAAHLCSNFLVQPFEFLMLRHVQ